MANAAALIWETLPDLNWAGFYRNVGGELVLGPFQGRPACIRIPFGTGVCGAAAASLPGPAGRGRPRLPRPHRLRRRLGQRAGRADRPRRRADRGARPRQPERRRGLTEEDEAGCVALGEMLLGEGRSSSTAPAARRSSEPGMIITGQGSLPASVPVKLATSGPGLPLGAAPSTSAATSSRSPIYSRTALTGSPLRARRSIGLDPGLVEDFADRRR